MGRTVRFYYDFLSPYSFLASQLIQRTPSYQTIDFAHKPVLFGSMLAKRGVKGPGEITSMRRIGLQDVLMLAAKYGIPVEGPPTHPFNSVYALRSICDLEDEKEKRALTHLYFETGWCRGEDLSDPEVLRRCLNTLGIEQDPEEAATKRENRAALKANTKEALECGAWGVPTFVIDDVVMFGHDRLALLADYLDGNVDACSTKLDELLARPQPGRIQ